MFRLGFKFVSEVVAEEMEFEVVVNICGDGEDVFVLFDAEARVSVSPFGKFFDRLTFCCRVLRSLDIFFVFWCTLSLIRRFIVVLPNVGSSLVVVVTVSVRLV